MQKVVIILIISYLISGCSTARIRNSDVTKNSSELSEGVLSKIVNQNITGDNFIIQRADIEIISENGKEKFMANVKFKLPDEYLLSIRSRTGIEAARIFMNSDTILINDRINKKLYCGSTGYIKKKYEITPEILPIIFGDMMNNNNSDNKQLTCKNNRLELDRIINGIRINYLIDCDKGKLLEISGKSEVNEKMVKLKFSDFFRSGNKKVPGKILLYDINSKTSLIILIKKISFPWEGNIVFIPGNRYEIVPLI